ncbi:hypothetical protein CEXT_783111 [Caerostris extrusa]|uniref:Uncharacterized protein n=1 Tax=Caerostris extrusa TaxID=172846 RepID=A0AAV4MES9_CAEEX|nr:hypothetical protein CEXT_783111 [Caerostris extrusa]
MQMKLNVSKTRVRYLFLNKINGLETSIWNIQRDSDDTGLPLSFTAMNNNPFINNTWIEAEKSISVPNNITDFGVIHLLTKQFSSLHQ